VIFVVVVLVVLYFELRASQLPGSASWVITIACFLCVGYFWDRVSFFCPGWPQILILLISASWVARIAGVSHQCPDHSDF
jgi:hypothetical protein